MKKIDRIVQQDIKKHYTRVPTQEEQHFRNLLKRIMAEADKKLEGLLRPDSDSRT